MASSDVLTQDLFAIDDGDVEMAAHSWPSSCPASLPPTSDFGDVSSGYDVNFQVDLDDEIPAPSKSCQRNRGATVSESESSDVEDFFVNSI